MAVPACPEVEISSQGLEVRLPGGPTLRPLPAGLNPDGLDVVKSLLAQGSAALAPLAPLFTLVDAVLAIKGFVEAVPDALGPPPDPTALAVAVKEVAKKVAKLAELIPQLSVPLMVVDLIDVVIAALDGAVRRLEAVVVQGQRIAAATALATAEGNDALLQVTVCAGEVAAATRDGIAESLAPLAGLFAVLNLFLGLIGAGEMPSLEALPEDAAEAVDQLRDLVDVLQRLRGTIPIP